MKKIIMLLFVLTGAPAGAYINVMDTGEMLAPGHFRAMIEPQYIFDKIPGAALAGRFDLPINDNLNGRVLLGGGAIDFESGAFIKWVPIPDYKNQPAIGLDAGVTYVRYW